MKNSGGEEKANAAHLGPFDQSCRPVVRSSGVLLAAALLILAGAVLFGSFLFGSNVLLYKDIGADSVNDSYPNLIHLSNYIRKQGLPSWSFCVGMGQSLFYQTGNLVWQPVVWLPKALIAYALVFQHLGKILVAGLFFLRFLQLRGLNFWSSCLGSVLLGLSSYMCMGSCWLVNADEVVGFTFLLFAIETAIARGRWLYLALAVGLIGLITVFHLYLAAVLLLLYVPGRLIETNGWKPASIFPACLRLAAVAFLGVGLAAFVGLGSLYSILNSPRGSGTIANFSWGAVPSIFQFEAPLYYVTAALRPFSSDLLGTGDGFRGWQNYFEAPIVYCGLLTLLLLPQVFLRATRRQRLLHGLFLGLILVPVIWPWFRYAFWLFHGGYFRTFSLFSILGTITLSMTALSRLMDKRILGLWTLGGTLLLLLGVLYLPGVELSTLVSQKLRGTVAVCLILYAGLLAAAARLPQGRTLAQWIILLMTAAELILFDGVTITRPTVTKHELDERTGYNDATVDAVRDIKASEHGFFRVVKTWGSGPAKIPSLNDAMAFDFYGTMSYSSFNNLNYIRFLIALDALSSDDLPTEAQWSLGLVGQPLLSMFACEKYVITTDPVPFQEAARYDFVKSYGKISLFRNKAFLPFGLAFDRYIPEDVFLQMPGWAKQLGLMHAAVLSDKDTSERGTLTRLSLDELKQQMRDIPLPEVMAVRRLSALEMRSFRQTRMEGTVRLDRKGVMVFQMPFDAGWRARVDGRVTSIFKVDVGLLGVVLEAGEHAVELRYSAPFLYSGAAVTLISLSILLFSVWRWPRIRWAS